MNLNLSLERWRQAKILLPVVSLAWAVFSGFRISRDFSNGWRLLVFAAGIWLVLFLFSWWTERASRHLVSVDMLGGFWQRLVRENGKVEWFAVSVAQFQAQYVLLFSLPFLYFSKSWVMFFLSVLITVTALWDPWWQFLIRFSAYERLVRSFTFFLATSFGIAIFVPMLAPVSQVLLLAVAVLTVLPLRALAQKGRGALGDFLSAHCWPLVVFWFGIGGAALGGFRVVPLLSVWVSAQASFGFDITSRNVSVAIKSPQDVGLIRRELASGKKLCCWTPIVAPRSLHSSVQHVWILNGKRVVDTIPVGVVTGLDTERAYRTYSCKSALELGENVTRIDCRVKIGKTLDIGGVALDLFNK
jgi:hypothetical protein